MKYSDVEIHSPDISIKIDGRSDIFGSVDLSLRAAMRIIESLDFKFAQDHIGMDYPQKAHIQIINSLGKSIKDQGFYPDELPNIEVVQHFLNWFIDESKLHQTEEYVELLKDGEGDEQ